MNEVETKAFVLSRSNLSQQIAGHLEEVILSSLSLKEGSKLASEQQLAEKYRVSRPVIREALKMLQERGLVKLVNGLGSFVTKPKTNTVEAAINRFSQMNDISDHDLTQMRGIIEVNAARLAALNAKAEDIEALSKNLEKFSDCSLSLKERVSLDSEFHILIAHASGNGLLEMFNQVLISMLADYMGKGVLTPGGVDDAIRRHKEVFQAISAHDVVATEKAMEEHLSVSEQNVKHFNRD
ncbi:MAG: FCD domain-containing protein [Candidatus Cloacimonetes bacterium]|nr:FCD domain-containing protein [Candidatus Cloacimonadota bacterium]